MKKYPYNRYFDFWSSTGGASNINGFTYNNNLYIFMPFSCFDIQDVREELKTYVANLN